MTTIAPFISDQYPATDEVQCITIYIPAGDEFKALAAGLLALATNPDNYDNPESAQSDGLAAIWDDAYSQTDWEGCVIPEARWDNTEVNCWAIDATVVVGSGLTSVVNTSQFFNLLSQQTTPALNNKVRFKRYMAAGVWTFKYLYQRLTNNGVIDIYVTPPVGSTVVAMNDADLRGTTLVNQVKTGTFTIVETGLQTIDIEVVATTSGSNYNNQWTLLQMWRTGD